jgi:hypothetical protein
MRSHSHIVITLLATLSLISCSSKMPRPVAEAVTSAPITIELAVLREIAGPILGKDLRNPTGLASDFRGTLYVCDAGNNRIIKFTGDLAPQKDRGGYGSQPGLLNNPRFIVVDNNLNILVSEAGNQRVSRFDAELNYVDEIRFYDDQDPLKFGTPGGVALTTYGELWISDKDKNRVTVWDNVGRFDRFVGDFGYSGGELSGPEKIITYEKDTFIVCDAGNHRLMVYDSYGSYARRIEDGSFEYPIATASDAKGRLWVIDQLTGRISLYSQEGRRLFVGGPQIVGSSKPLSRPSDLIVLPGDRLLIADSGNNRLVECRIIFGNP